MDYCDLFNHKNVRVALPPQFQCKLSEIHIKVQNFG